LQSFVINNISEISQQQHVQSVVHRQWS